jgi:hypothetical protein
MTDQLPTIDGRTFHGVTQELSAAQDDFLIGHLRLSGALDTLLSAKNNPQEQSERLLTQIMVSGRGAQVLAGCLTEVGKSWTYEDAARNAARFAAITDLKDKMAMREAVVQFVAGFFLFATRSAATSRKSSSPS